MSTQDESNETMGAAPVTGLVPMLHVADVERSIRFYRLLGFEVGNKVPRVGPLEWAWLYAPNAAEWRHGPNLMLTRSDCAIEPDAQQVLLPVCDTVGGPPR